MIPAQGSVPFGRPRSKELLLLGVVSFLLRPSTAHASFLHGETLDNLADVIAWVALILVPIIVISVFWMVHILPEKIAEKRHHPQAKAIKTLCLLSLCFGGILWPLAWIWAYTKPVLHKMAYGTDVEEPHGDGGHVKAVPESTVTPKAWPAIAVEAKAQKEPV